MTLIALAAALALVAAGVILAALVHELRLRHRDRRPGYLPPPARAPRAGRSVRAPAAAEVRPEVSPEVSPSRPVRDVEVLGRDVAGILGTLRAHERTGEALAARLAAVEAAPAADPTPPPPPAPGDSPPAGEAQRARVGLDARAHVFGGSWVVLRFVGDPTGYVVDWNSSDRPHGWVFADAGGRSVRVDAGKAYLIERVGRLRG